jgi:purine-nucleoside phosphorylase
MRDIVGFPPPAVAGHAGTISSVAVGGHAVLVLAGRAHLYEGHPPASVVHGVRTAVLAGCRTVVLTNAAGSLRADLPVGRPVLISDHLNLTGTSPLLGPAPPDPYPARFVDLSDAYSARLRVLARSVDPSLPEGVYAALLGGAYETPAEIRMLLELGADLVGMSTALETIAAVHLGAEVLGLSLVTNLAAGLAASPLDHVEVLAAGASAAASLGELLRAIIERI